MKDVLTRRRRQSRLQWARAHLRFTRADWAYVLFSDEACFNVNGNDGRLRCIGARTNVSLIIVLSRGIYFVGLAVVQ